MNKTLLLKHKFQFIVFSSIFHDQRGGRYPVQVNDDFHLIHVTQGTGTLVIDKQRYPLRRGVVMSIPPFTGFYFDINLPFEMLNIHYRLWLENGDPLEAHAGLPVMFKPSDFSAIETQLRRMASVKGDEVAWHMRLAPLAHEIVMRHCLAHPLVSMTKQPLDSRIKKGYTLLASPEYRKFNAGEAAKMSGLSVSQMNRIFRRSFRMSPHQLWDWHRFLRICRLLRATDRSIVQIAADNEFEDVAYLSKWFKKMAKCSPLYYRKKREEKT